jgi:paraquat-inducible protein B
MTVPHDPTAPDSSGNSPVPPEAASPQGPSGQGVDGPDGLPRARAVARDRFSLVWLLPLLALATGAWLAYQSWSQRGPIVTIELRTAAGLEAGKTRVRYKDVEIGEVTAIDVSDDLSRVIVRAELKHGAEKFLTDNTRFWVARPRVSVSRVSGLETLLSGAYVAIDPAPGRKGRRRFIGLSDPPVITTDEPGTRFRLRSDSLGSLNLGSPVYYRQIRVGQVIDYQLDEDGGAVTIGIFVARPHDRLVLTNTRFWNASGIEVKLGADGVRLDTESLMSVLLGGVSFDTPESLETKGAPASAEQFFPLYPSREDAHKRIYLHKERYRLVFSGSARGLNIGAPVLLRGIEIGQVLDVQLQFDSDAPDFVIAVLIEVEPERIAVEGDRDRQLAQDADVLQRLVAAGLRAQLKTGSLLTGQLYVDLDFHPEAPPAKLSRRGEHQVLPTLPAPLEAVTTKINRVLTRVEGLPLEAIGDDLRATTAGVRELIDSGVITRSLDELERTLRELRALSASLDDQIAPELAETLTEARRALASANALIQPDAPLNVEAVRAMRELSEAARSIRVMADYLQRHPEALIKGKGGGR